MTYQELMKHYEGMSLRQVAKQIGLKSPSALVRYREHGIPLARQMVIEVRTDSTLKVDRAKLNAKV